MRLLEILILVTLFIAIIRPVLPGKRLLRFLPLVALLLTISHLLLESYRWTMVPAYALTVILLVGMLPELRHPTTRKRPILAGIAVLLGLAWLVIATALPTLLPVFSFPALTGEYSVGRVVYSAVDTGREERYDDTAGINRHLSLIVWYPAETSNAPVVSYIADHALVAPAVSVSQGMPPFTFDYLRHVQPHAQENVPVNTTESAYPVVIFSHGLGLFPEMYTTFAEDLASHGYIVVAINHPYASSVVVQQDGSLLQEVASVEETAERDMLISEMALDAQFVMDWLTQINTSDSWLQNRVDLSHIGTAGHSIGGAAAAEVCRIDNRCTAAVILDTALGTAALENDFEQPVMFIRANIVITDAQREIARSYGATDAEFEAEFAQMRRDSGETTFEQRDSNAYLVTIDRMAHSNFTDMPLVSSLFQAMGVTGSIDGAYGLQIVNDYMHSFFDVYLHEKDAPLLTIMPSQYLEVTYLSRG